MSTDGTPPPGAAQTPPPPPVAAPPPTAASPGSYPPPTNALAIIALVLGIVVPPGGIIAGHIALSQIRRTREAGRGLALAGTIVGYCLTGFIVLYVLAVLAFALVPLLLLLIVGAASGFGSGFSEGGDVYGTALTLLI